MKPDDKSERIKKAQEALRSIKPFKKISKEDWDEIMESSPFDNPN